MAINRLAPSVGYGLSDALPEIFPAPLVSTRDPQTGDKAQLGTLWVNKATDDAFILTSVVANSATWITVGGGSGIFTSLTVTPGNLLVTNGNITASLGDITATAGDLVATSGNLVVGGTADITGNLTVSSGDIVATAGNVSVTLGNVTVSAGDITVTTGGVDASSGSVIAGTLEATDDLGGTVGNTAISNVVNTTQGVGVLTILATNGNSGNNTGFLKFYVGTTPVFVPYFVTITPP